MADQLQVLDKRLARTIDIESTLTDYAGDLMRKQVVLQNKSKMPQSLQYRFSWSTREGVAVRPESQPWLPVQLLGNEQKMITGTAPSPTATDFTLMIKRAEE